MARAAIPFLLAPATLLVCAGRLPAQTPAAPNPAPAPFVWHGFAAATSFRDLLTRTQRMVPSDGVPLACNSSPRTAQLLDCGAAVRDSADGSAFYLSAYVVEGVVAMISIGDSGTAAFLDSLQQELRAAFGPPARRTGGMWEWRAGSSTARLAWRGRGAVRWTYVSLVDDTVMARIGKYARPVR